MAITRRAPVSDDVSNSRIVVSVALIVALAAIIACLMWVKRRIRQTTPVATPLERLPSHEVRRRKGIESYMLESIPVVTYRASLESNEQEAVSKIGNSTGGALGDDPPKRPSMVQTEEGRGKLPVMSLDAVIEDVDMPLDKDVAQGKERKSSRQDSKTCSICTEDFVEGRNVRILPCRHIYHRRCIDPWLLNFAGTCPLCRIALEDLVPPPTQPPRPPEPVVLPSETVSVPVPVPASAPAPAPLLRVASRRRISR